MKITESRANILLRWLDSMTADHTLLFEEMTLFRDTAALVRQLQAAEQAAWHAGLDAGRAQRPAAVDEDGMVDFEIHAGGEYFASVFVPRERAREEAMRYVSMMSPEDGKPKVLEVTRRKIVLAAQPGGSDNDQ